MRGILRISFLIIIGILIGGFSAAVVFLTFFNRSASVQGVYGIYNINGVVPQGATITLLQKERGSDEGFVAFAEGTVPEDEGMWHFDQAKKGKSYEIQGLLLQNGQVSYQTSPIFVTAPMINQVLVFNLETPTATGNATISGNIGINGYIPPGATLVLEAREFGTQEFTPVVKDIPARDNQVVSYTTATAGRIYEIQAILLNSAQKEIGTSDILQVAAPANNEELSINSTLQPPITPTPTPTPTPQAVAPQVTATATPNPTPTPTPASQIISGVIRFGGQAPTNSRIVIFQRVTGTQQFILAVDNLTPQDGTTWQWTGATGGTSYDLIAILKQKNSNGTDTDISNSNVITVAAPAANEVFTINSGFLLSAPSGNITVSCNNYNSSNQTWTVGVSFQSVTNAQSYWYQIGVTNGGAELTNFTQNASNNTAQAFIEQFQNNVTYYARYANANVQNLQANDPQFSPFSSTTQLRCSQ